MMRSFFCIWNIIFSFYVIIKRYRRIFDSQSQGSAMEKYLDEELTAYGRSDIYPFHMPGHKRQRMGEFTPEQIDITEVEGFDNLHHAEGILREGQERLAQVFGADESFYLVGGSTAGILAAVCGCMKRGGRLLIARNCHKSVYHAAYLMEAKLAYVCPEQTEYGICGSVAPSQIDEALERFPDTQAVVITSPTYDGVVSDIRAIADLVHARQIPLIVDAAHGAHFGFSKGFPEKAIAQGADLCVESLHKTLPAYTQSAALHQMRTMPGDGEEKKAYLFNADRVRRYLAIFQSSSPSYVLMAGIDRCVRIIRDDAACYAQAQTRAGSLFGQFEGRLNTFYQSCDKLRQVQVIPGTEPGADTDQMAGIFARDPSKILIRAQRAGLNGPQLYDLLLDRYHLQMEMAAPDYVTALTTIMDTDEGFARLLLALEETDRQAAGRPAREAEQQDLLILYGPMEKSLEIAEAMDAETTDLALSRAAGHTSAEFVFLYPPGIPILVPGEVISEDVTARLEACAGQNLRLQGMRDLSGKRIQVIA